MTVTWRMTILEEEGVDQGIWVNHETTTKEVALTREGLVEEMKVKEEVGGMHKKIQGIVANVIEDKTTIEEEIMSKTRDVMFMEGQEKEAM